MKNSMMVVFAVSMLASLVACDVSDSEVETAVEEAEDLAEAPQAFTCAWESGWDAPTGSAPEPAPDYFPAYVSDSEYGDYFCDTYTVYFSGADDAHVAVGAADRPSNSITCVAASIEYRYRIGTPFGGGVLWGSWTEGSVSGVWYSGGGSGTCYLRKNFALSNNHVQIEAFGSDLAGDAIDLHFQADVD